MGSLADLDVELADASAVAERRSEVLAAVRDHAGRVAYGLARLQGGDYGSRSFTTDRGEWTLSYEAGDIEYLRYEPRGGGETYVVSTQAAADPEPLAAALDDYGAFLEAYNEYVDSLAGILDGVETSGAPVESTDGIAAERDRILETIERCCETMARELRRCESSEYGSYAARVDGTRWKLKWDADDVSYLRVGGSGGVYLVSQYGPPSATDLREYAPRFGGFVDAYNDHVVGLEHDLRRIEL